MIRLSNPSLWKSGLGKKTADNLLGPILNINTVKQKNRVPYYTVCNQYFATILPRRTWQWNLRRCYCTVYVCVSTVVKHFLPKLLYAYLAILVLCRKKVIVSCFTIIIPLLQNVGILYLKQLIVHHLHILSFTFAFAFKILHTLNWGRPSRPCPSRR